MKFKVGDQLFDSEEEALKYEESLKQKTGGSVPDQVSDKAHLYMCRHNRSFMWVLLIAEDDELDGLLSVFTGSIFPMYKLYLDGMKVKKMYDIYPDDDHKDFILNNLDIRSQGCQLLSCNDIPVYVMNTKNLGNCSEEGSECGADFDVLIHYLRTGVVLQPGR